MDLCPADRYVVPDSLRPALARPWGPVVDTGTLRAMLRPDDVLLCVGDIVSITALDLGLHPKLIVCDYRTLRGHDPELRRRLEGEGREVGVHNPAAVVTREAWQAVRDAVAAQGTTRIVVDGEEDLLGIPCFLEGNVGDVVLYGMPGRGIVVCRITQELQKRVADLVQTMAGA